MRRTSLLLSMVLVAGIFAPTSAQAQDSGFGLGIILGDPNGVSGKGWLSERMALDGAIGFGIIDEGHLYVFVDVLWQFEITQLERVNIDWYVGVGPKIAIFNNRDDSLYIGARGPIGIDFEFTPKVPLDLFVEVAAGLWFIQDVDFDIDAAVGLRYWF